jgi:hypothetical protein
MVAVLKTVGCNSPVGSNPTPAAERRHMLYILTEEEYKKLVEEPGKIREEMQDIINSLCVEVAMNKVVHVDWVEEDEPWGCHVHFEETGTGDDEWPCEHCPVIDKCGHYKYTAK